MITVRHVKTQGLYRVLNELAFIEATQEQAVVYQSLADGKVWVRPYDEFHDGRFQPADGRDEEIERLRGAIKWALGANGTFPPRGTGDGAYWWRTELSQRSGVKSDK